MTGLAAPGTRAVLVGTGRHAPGSTLPDLPGVGATLDDLARALHETCGMPKDHIHRVPADATAPQVLDAVEQAVGEATGTVLFCYTGHGLLGPDDELYLATHGTPSEDRIAQGVPYHALKGLLGRVVGGSVVILDCCFSGRATAPGRDGPAAVLDSALPDGSFLLTSASDFALSYAPEGERHTLFGGRLLRLLAEGDPSGPPRLTLDDVHAFLDRSFRDGPVRPHRHSAGNLDKLVVAPNHAYRPQRPPDALPPAAGRCPYPGMEPFRAGDRDHFHGRKEITGRLLDAVCDPDADGHPLVLVGASGAGKSSLLRAGLIAGLDGRRAEGHAGTPWPAVLLPAVGPHPLRALAERWARATGRPADEVHRALAAGDGLPAPSPGLPAVRLLVVDQFEETFTRCTDPEERARFVQLLCAGDGGPRVVLGLRADHYGSCLAHPELVQALEHRQFTVPPMDAKALRDAVEEPAREAGLVLEAGLTDRLLADLEEDADLGEDADASDDVTALPFLAHALRETWLRRSGAALTLAGYQATGGIRKSVAMATEALYQELDGPGRSALRELLLRMVHLTARAEAVRRRLDLPALLADRPEEDRRRIGAVWERLAAARLVTVDQGGAQISHEALLRAWLRLRSWIREARAELLAHQQLSEAAAAWEEHGRDPGYLYTGSRLAAVRPLLTAPGMTLTTGERAFAEAGLRSARRARLRRTVVASVSGCLALLLTAVGTFALSERSRSQERAAELASKRIAAQAEALRSRDPAAALDLSLAAYRAAATAEARTSLLRSAMTPVSLTLTGHKDRVLNLALHKSGRVMASSSKDGTVRLWDIGDPYRPAPGAVLRTGKGVALAWRPDGRYLVATSADTFFVWDTSDPFRPREVARAAGGGQGIHGVAFSPDGRTVAVASARGRVRLWNMGDPARPVSTMFRVQSDQDVRAVAYRPDGKVLATGLDDGTVQLWEPGRTGEFEQLATTKGEPVGSLAFRPDGRRLAAGALRFVRFWDTEDPRHPRGLPNGLGSLQPQYVAVAFSADGQHIAAASTAEREVQTFDLDDKHGRADQGSRLPIGEPAWSVTYLPGGRGLAVGDETGRILLNLPPPRSLPGSVTDRTMGETGSATDESGRHLITDGYRENSPPVRVWDIGAPGRVPRRIAELSREWEQARFFPGGLVVSWNTGRTRLKLWRLDGDRLRPAHEFPRPEEVKKDTNWTEFSVNRDATLLALRAPGDDAMRLWDIRDRDHPRQLGRMPWPQGDGRVVAGFSGSKGLVAMMSNSSTQVWDVRDARHPRPAGKAKGRPFSTLGHDGRVALLTQETKQPTRTSELRLWTVDDDGTPHRSRSIGEDVDSIAALSGRALLTLSKDGRPAVWDLRKPQRGVPLPGPAPRMRYVMVSEERRLAVARNYEGALGIWRVSEPDGARPGGDDELLALFTDGDIGKVHELDDATGDLFVETGFAGPVAALGARTIVVSTDTDRLRAGLCAVRSTRVPEERWRELLPGVGRRDGCG